MKRVYFFFFITVCIRADAIAQGKVRALQKENSVTKRKLKLSVVSIEL